MAIADEIVRLQNAKANIKASIEAKGVEVPEGSIETYPALIDEIKTQGNYQEKTVTPSKELQIINPDEGYDALKSVLVSATPLEEKTVTPTRDTQGLVPSNGNIGFSKVTVNGDSNLFPSNIKKGTTIFGIEGTYEGEAGGGGTGGGTGDYSSLGTPVTVEARSSFNAGDRFVGVKNDSYVVPTITSAQLSSESIITASEDLSVCVMAQTITNNSETLRIGFLNDLNEYEMYDVDLPSMSFRTGVVLSATNTSVSEDGSLIAISGDDSTAVWSSYYGLGVLVVSVNVSSKTASASYKGNFYEMGDYQYTTGGTTYDIDYGYFMNYQTAPSVIATGNYLLISGRVRMAYTDSTGAAKALTYAVNSLHHSGKGRAIHQYVYNSSYYSPWLSCAWRSNNTLMATINSTASTSYQGKLYKFVVDGATLNNVTSANLGGGVITYHNLSANGLYLSSGYGTTSSSSHTVSSINADLSLNRITIISPSSGNSPYSYPDDTGSQVLLGSGQVFDTSASATSITSAPSISSRHFNLKSGFYRSSNRKVYYSPQSSEPEYIISSTQAYIETADRIYGIVPEAMATGEIGVAQGLFNTFNL